jgi:tetratricopeptide (TPR) repeat protein
LLRLGRHEQAAAACLEAIRLAGREPAILLALGKARLAQGRGEESRALFDEAARLEPKNLEAAFRREGAAVARADFLEALTAPGRRQALELSAWGELYAREGMREQAIACQRAALREDAQCFPARLSLAETLAADQRFGPALEELRRLDQETPGNRKVLIAWARALSWSKDYQGSLELYRRVGELDPRDPLPVMEAARVAAWGKMMDRAQELYASLTRPAVDDRLAQGLRGLARSQPFAGSADRQRLQELADAVQAGRSHAGYEKAGELAPGLGLTPRASAALEGLMLGLRADYHIQKAALLESLAKRSAWDKRFARSLEQYQELEIGRAHV